MIDVIGFIMLIVMIAKMTSDIRYIATKIKSMASSNHPTKDSSHEID